MQDAQSGLYDMVVSTPLASTKRLVEMPSATEVQAARKGLKGRALGERLLTVNQEILLSLLRGYRIKGRA